ncbi:MAG: Tad domain-containing protein [Acidimicrobiia bacterium]|nr:Tad domain-containing protein [Acidimicrobiia bacterium]
MRRRLTSRSRSPRRAGRVEHGFILVWTTLMLVVMLAIGGLAVDLGRWYVESQKLQRAADAAAMAGVVHRSPAEDASADPRWRTVAARVAEANGYTNDVGVGAALSDVGDVRVEASIRSCDGPGNDEHCVELPANQLKVTVETRIPNLLAGLVGLDIFDVRRGAIAEYQGEVQMGSPSNVLGNEPVAAGDTRWGTGEQFPGYWLSVQGPRTLAYHGDLLQSEECRVEGGLSGSGDRADPCLGPDKDPRYQEDYVFTIRVEEPDAADTLKVDLFDPVFYPVGSACGGHGTNHPAYLADWIRALQGPGAWLARPLLHGFLTTAGGMSAAGADAAIDALTVQDASRYDAGATGFCSGDNPLNGRVACPDHLLDQCVPDEAGLIGIGIGAGLCLILPILPWCWGGGGGGIIGRSDVTPPIAPPDTFGDDVVIGDPDSFGPDPLDPGTTVFAARATSRTSVRPATEWRQEDPAFYPMTDFRLEDPQGVTWCQARYPWFNNADWNAADNSTKSGWAAIQLSDDIVYLWARNDRWDDLGLQAPGGFRDWYRRWVRFCDVPGPSPGDWHLHVSTHGWTSYEWSNDGRYPIPQRFGIPSTRRGTPTVRSERGPTSSPCAPRSAPVSSSTGRGSRCSPRTACPSSPTSAPTTSPGDRCA